MSSLNLKCPKCGSAALGSQKTELPTSVKKPYISLHCLTCGARFDLVEKSQE